MDRTVYKLVASDLDSTMITETLELPGENIAAVERARRSGCHVVICSGRSTASIMPYEERLGLVAEGCYGISFNGGIVYETVTRKKIRDIRLGSDIAIEILDELVDGGVNPWIYAGDDLYVVKETEWVREYAQRVKTSFRVVESFKEIGDEISKLLVVDYPERLLKIDEQFSKRAGGRYNQFFSAEFLFEFTAKSATKGDALVFLADYLGIPISQTIAIGDNLNDVHMIEAAGFSVAVRNGRDELKALADYVTERNCAQGAVAEVIEKFVL
ncbi:MAG: Cof-type HAD-IIB family hydrolase [Defluviitaleaceae bacterium]|nr:Cof-type HAD-IIB family hydrolase [Defluviitaleaceae bacterium]